uniref:Uncharacterized protein n=1 Tax=Candidatus Kentrum sp. TUN TaxID=2126343 RepID=A0A450ZUW1_9GAMM|nr:MAG: hypothetical protein BECKTUN1418F_GA0071002_11223 [Candidatus Kentron sp. TUN]VFK65826.1 MAG: hypothetical protein BECKTUN1418E_GA0071001_11142 [Candidatus Kentron sp. TUN]
MKKIILRQAFEELRNAITYYEEQQAGLGLRLKNLTDMSIGLWVIQPFHGFVAVVTAMLISRCFRIILPTLSAGAPWWILAVAHGHRRPEYWIGRKNKIS